MNLAQLVHGPVRRGRRVVLLAASVQLPAAGVIGIVGVNGAGKSTLFHALAGSLSARANACIRGSTARPGERVAFAPQQPAFPEWLEVTDAARLYGWDFSDLARETPGMLLEEIANLPVQALSAGQRQALAVALALAGESPLTLLDEPCAFLDFRRRFGLAALLRARRAASAAGLVMVASQSAADLLDTCDWILVLRDGRYVYSGAADSLAAGIADPARARQRFEEVIMALLGAASPHRFRAGSPGSLASAAGI